MQFTSLLASLILATAVAAGPIPGYGEGLGSTIGSVTGSGNGAGSGDGNGSGSGNAAGNGSGSNDGDGNKAGNGNGDGNEVGNGNKAGNGNSADFLNNINLGETSQQIAQWVGACDVSWVPAIWFRAANLHSSCDSMACLSALSPGSAAARSPHPYQNSALEAHQTVGGARDAIRLRELSPIDVESQVSRDEPDESLENIGASASQTSPEGTYSVDGHPTERFMWPRFLSRLRDTFSLDSEPAKEEHVGTSMQAQVLRTPPLQPAELQRLRKAVDAFPPRPVADFLLSVCINHGTDSFFYFNQAQLLAEVNEFYTNSASRLRSDCSFVCLAHAAFALGSQWTTMARPGKSSTPLILDDSDPGRIFYNQARSLIPDVIDMPCLRAVQAPFVMGVYLLPASAIGSSYIYLGLALRKALALDLHLTSDEMSVGQEEKEIRRRVWWSIYSLERASTVKLNRPRSIDSSIITVSFPQRYEPLDKWQKFDNVEHQIADARLMMILDKVAEPPEWPSASDGSTPFEAELKGWKRSLPDSLRLQNVHPQSSYYRATFHLYTNYYFTWIAMGKVSVVTVVRAKLRYHLGRDSQAPEIAQHIEALAKTCVKAAKKTLRLFEDIRTTGNLTRFSFTDFQACSIATIVVILAGILERDAGSERQVSFGLDCLKKMAEGNVTATMGVSFVEALQSIANEAVAKLMQMRSNFNLPTDEPPPLQSDYHSWASWLSRQNSSSNSIDAALSEPQLPGSSTLQQMEPAAWPLPQAPSTPTGFTTWDGAAALQQLSIPALATVDLTENGQGTFQPQTMDTAFFSNMYNDDQAFLMGLTGFDILGFPGLQDEL
ncbi:putative Transcription factor domain-containing protein [Seiridium cardinale]|uniref:Transcription factor domain-containing protein n=1 Tax=Seiridium cardinale TaxID=138064 RepID=A0ABR2Y918_9PEZI